MAFDPTKPANNSPVSSAELRTQLTGLKALIDQCPTDAMMQGHVVNFAAGNCDGVAEMGIAVADPPTQADVQEIANKLDELIHVLKRIT